MAASSPSAVARCRDSGDEGAVGDGGFVQICAEDFSLRTESARVQTYRKVFADNGGDKDKVCSALGLDSSKWADGGEAAFLATYILDLLPRPVALCGDGGRPRTRSPRRLRRKVDLAVTELVVQESARMELSAKVLQRALNALQRYGRTTLFAVACLQVATIDEATTSAAERQLLEAVVTEAQVKAGGAGPLAGVSLGSRLLNVTSLLKAPSGSMTATASTQLREDWQRLQQALPELVQQLRTAHRSSQAPLALYRCFLDLQLAALESHHEIREEIIAFLGITADWDVARFAAGAGAHAEIKHFAELWFAAAAREQAWCDERIEHIGESLR